MSKTFTVAGRIFRWKVCVYEDGKFLRETNHTYRFKPLAELDAANFNLMEQVREREINLDYGE